MNEGEGKKPDVEPSFIDLLFPEVLHFRGSETYLFRESLAAVAQNIKRLVRFLSQPTTPTMEAAT